MGLLAGFKDEITLLKDTLKIMKNHPALLYPLIICYTFVSALILYMKYYYTLFGDLYAVILQIFIYLSLITISITFANLIMLEIIQQIESGKQVNLQKAIKDALFRDVIKAVPLALLWSFLWTLIVFLKALTRRGHGSGGDEKFTPRNAARTLVGATSSPFSWFRLGLNMMSKLVRMTTFMALPAIAWEDRGPFSSFKKAFGVIKTHPYHMLSAYTLTLGASALMAIPAATIIMLDKYGGYVFSDAVWYGVMIYIIIVWTVETYLEQMSVGLLYLWHMKWQKAGSKGELASVKKPDLLDEIHELNEL